MQTHQRFLWTCHTSVRSLRLAAEFGWAPAKHRRCTRNEHDKTSKCMNHVWNPPLCWSTIKQQMHGLIGGGLATRGSGWDTGVFGLLIINSWWGWQDACCYQIMRLGLANGSRARNLINTNPGLSQLTMPVWGVMQMRGGCGLVGMSRRGLTDLLIQTCETLPDQGKKKKRWRGICGSW